MQGRELGRELSPAGRQEIEILSEFIPLFTAACNSVFDCPKSLLS